MTVTGNTVCSLIQSFPVLLILAQNANKCLKTPFIYKPPIPTQTPEYYEAYDALIHALLHDKCSYKKPCHSHPTYTSYPSYPSYPESGYGHAYPYGYAHLVEKYPGFESYPDGYSGYSHNRYRLANGLNMSTNYMYKTNYAPNQIYNTKHKQKIVIVKSRGPKFEKLQEETCRNVDGGDGICIVLNNCEPYQELLARAKTDSDAKKLLRKSHCGFEKKVPKVCCPRLGAPTTSSTKSRVVTNIQGRKDPMSRIEEANDYATAFPEPPLCGVSNGYFGEVVGGVDANLGDFPWIALLGYKNRSDSSPKWRCAGSLITNRHVLTAAHCIHNLEDELDVVRLGELDLVRDDDGATPIDVPIKRQIRHEQYDSASYENDIAVLVLEEIVEFTKLISPICLPLDIDLRSKSFERYNPMIAGWALENEASAEQLKLVELPVQRNDLCVKAYARYKKQIIIDEKVMCAGFTEESKGSCQGDSGGPLTFSNWKNATLETYFYQIGVVSYGKNCAEAGFPGVYSRITHFMPWLEKVVLGI